MDAGSRKRPAPHAEKHGAAKAARLGEEELTSTAYVRATLIEQDDKTAAHEVAWPEGREGSDAPPPPRAGPAAKEYPFVLDPFQRCAINCLETGESAKEFACIVAWSARLCFLCKGVENRLD